MGTVLHCVTSKQAEENIRKIYSWKHYAVRPGVICCHQAACSWVPEPKLWQSLKVMTANMFAMAKSHPLSGAGAPGL